MKIISAAFAVAAILAAPSPLRAAPDGTLGMTIMSAAVYSGFLSSGSGVVLVEKPAVGDHYITFARDLTDCTCVASFGSKTNDGYVNNGQAFISTHCPYSNEKNKVRVLTNLGGAPADNYGFQLVVFCPR